MLNAEPRGRMSESAGNPRLRLAGGTVNHVGRAKSPLAGPHSSSRLAIELVGVLCTRARLYWHCPYWIWEDDPYGPPTVSAGEPQEDGGHHLATEIIGV